MSEAATPAAGTALLIVDLQNDFLDPEGAYGRAGQAASDIAALPQRIKPLADELRRRGPSRAATFTWERTARETDQAIEPLLATSG